MRRSAADAKRQRLEGLLEGRDPVALGLRSLAEDAELVGSLALDGIGVEWDTVRASREGGALPAAAAALRRAQLLFPSGSPLDGTRLMALCLAVGDGDGLRRGALSEADASLARPLGRIAGRPVVWPARIEVRLEILGGWLGTDSVGALHPAAAGALVLVRFLEIAPLAHGNGRLARLVAAHLMASRQAHRPILVAGDADRLTDALNAASGMNTAPLVALLEEASERAVDLELQAVESGLVRLDPA